MTPTAGTTTATRQVTVNNVAPTLAYTPQGDTVAEGSAYKLGLSWSDPGSDTLTWHVDWDDGTTDNVDGETKTLSHVFRGTAGQSFDVSISAQDEDGTYTLASPSFCVALTAAESWYYKVSITQTHPELGVRSTYGGPSESDVFVYAATPFAAVRAAISGSITVDSTTYAFPADATGTNGGEDKPFRIVVNSYDTAQLRYAGTIGFEDEFTIPGPNDWTDKTWTFTLTPLRIETLETSDLTEMSGDDIALYTIRASGTIASDAPALSIGFDFLGTAEPDVDFTWTNPDGADPNTPHMMAVKLPGGSGGSASSTNRATIAPGADQTTIVVRDNNDRMLQSYKSLTVALGGTKAGAAEVKGGPQVTLQNGLLSITGTDADDEIKIDAFPVGVTNLNNVQYAGVSINGEYVGKTFHVRGQYAPTKILFEGLGGNDVIDAQLWQLIRVDGHTRRSNSVFSWETLPLVSTTLSGGDGDDTLIGAEKTDSIVGSTGNDVLYGRAGNDKLYGGEGNDFLTGEAGNDQLAGGPGNDTVSYSYRTEGITVNLSTGCAGTGTDTDTLNGLENIIGTNANDTLHGDITDNRIRGLGGQDVIDGRGGVDTVDYGYASSGVTVNLASQTGGVSGTTDWDTLEDIEQVAGSNYNDTLTGDQGPNTIWGQGGDDAIYGSGADTVASGNDYLDGGDGNDLLYGRDGNDTLYGADGMDTLYGGSGADMLLGGIGNDRLYGEGESDSLDGGSADDTINTGDDMLDGGAG